MIPSTFTIGRLTIHYYGIILMIGAMAAAFLAAWQARRRGLNEDLVWDSLIWVLIGGIIGARIWHVMFPQPSDMIMNPLTGQLENPYFANGTIRILDMLSIWNGGLGIPGAILGGGLALYIFCRRNKLNFGTWVDIAAPALALGQAIGRWGNFVNQELYGAPTNLPWGIYIEPKYRVPGYENFDRFHPLFLYESLWNIANMVFLLWLWNRYSKRLKSGDLLLVYLITYPVGRFLLEFLRLNAAQVAGINANQTIMAIVAVVSAALLILRHRKTGLPAEEPEPVEDSASTAVTDPK